MAQASLESQLLALVDRLRVLYASRDLSTLLAEATGAVCQLADAERAFFFLPDETTGSLGLAHGQDRQGATLDAAPPRVLEVARGVFHDRREVIATDTPARPQVARAPNTELRLRLLVCLPLVLGERCLGVVYADGQAAPGQGVFTRVLTALAEHVAQALDNAATYERATGDLLTGLPNASFFLGQLAGAQKDAAAKGPGGLLLVDLDDFKRVNLAGGAEVGDRALRDVAHSLRDILKGDGLVTRYGSDKFAVLLAPDRQQKIQVRLRDAAERARATVAARAFVGVRLSACVGGVAVGPDDARKSPGELVAACDNMLARARARGPGQVEVA